MTEIIVKKKNGNIVEISACGHTGYANSGKDILCSAVSTLLQTACLGVNKILKINAKTTIDEKRAYLKLAIPNLETELMEKVQIILKTTLLGLEDIAFGNEKYIKLEVKDEIN